MATIEAKAEMLIRRPVAEVFAAFVDPAVTTRIWFTRLLPAIVWGMIFAFALGRASAQRQA